MAKVTPGAPPPGHPLPPQELVAQMRMYKVNVCRNFQRGSCFYGVKCHFAHGDHEQRPEGMGPTPEEAARAGNQLPPELMAWWRAVRKEQRNGKTRNIRPADDAANNTAHRPDDDDEELRMLREQFPEEFQTMLTLEQKEQWHEATRPAKRAGHMEEPVTPPPVRIPANNTAAQRPPQQPNSQPPQPPQPPRRAAAQSSLPTPAANSTLQTLAQEVAELTEELRVFLSLPEGGEQQLALWRGLDAQHTQYKKRGVDMANKIMELGEAIDELQEAEAVAGGSKSKGLHEMQLRHAAAEQEYLELAPLFSKMNKLWKQAKKCVDAAVALVGPPATMTTAAPAPRMQPSYYAQPSS